MYLGMTDPKEAIRRRVTLDMAAKSDLPAVKTAFDHLMVATTLAHGEDIAQMLARQHKPYWMSREQLLRRVDQTNHPFGLAETMPPCSRHDDKEDHDAERVKAVWHYAMGIIYGERAVAIGVSLRIARLHDHKGTLVVGLWEGISESAKTAFRTAWADIGYEPEENVEFLTVPSHQWDRYWSSRRFRSDWTGEKPWPERP